MGYGRTKGFPAKFAKEGAKFRHGSWAISSLAGAAAEQSIDFWGESGLVCLG
jgi:hypothetical protein